MSAGRRGVVALCVALFAVGCGPTGTGTDAPAGELPVLAAGAVPVVEIGAVEDESEYLFEHIVGVLPLSSGALVVADGGSNSLSIYSPEGRFHRTWGGSGGGPAEFRRLSGIHPHGSDSLLALDGATRRISVFDTAGSLGRTLEGSRISGDETFALDDWLYGPNWIRGALRADRRAAVREVLARLRGPAASPGYRRVRVEDGRAGTGTSTERVWVRASGASRPLVRLGEADDAVNDEGVPWVVLDHRGSPESIVVLPSRFEALNSAGSRVYGRWTGELGVQSVRIYDLEDTGALAEAPGWIPDPEDPTAGTSTPDSVPSSGSGSGSPVPEEMRAALLELARAQEIHYAGAGTYTAALDSLDLDAPDGIWIDIVTADDRGWVAALVIPGSRRVCGLGYGAATPPGWRAGSMACAPPVP